MANGLPTVTGFTESFTLEAAFLVVAMFAGLLVPTTARELRGAALEPELAHAQEAG